MLAFLFVPSGAGAAQRPLVGDPAALFSANADGSLLKVSGDLGGTNLATVDLAHSQAKGDQAGSSAYGHNTGTLTALAGAIDLTTVLAQADQTAPPVQPAADDHTLIPVPAAPLANVGVSEATARAAFAGGTAACTAADQPMSYGIVDTAGADVLSAAGAPTLIGMSRTNSGAVDQTNVSTYLAADANGDPALDPRIVQSNVTITTEGLDVLTVSGSAPLLHVSTTQPYGGTVFADGHGHAGDSFVDPVVNVSIAGQSLIALTSGQSTTVTAPTPALPIPPLTSILDQLSPLLNGLSPILQISVPPVVHNAAADGTSASVSGALLQVDVLAALGDTPLLSLTLAPFSAAATAPVGGLFCHNPENPIHVSKTSSKTVAQPGETFDYTITFNNSDSTCTLTNTSLTDVISGPADSAITGTNPTATSVEGLVVTWGPDVVGDIPPNTSKTFTVTVKVPSSAKSGDSYSDTATAKGSCRGNDYTSPFTLDGIPRIESSLLARTGIDATFPMMGGGALVLAALGLRRLRRA